MHLRRTVICCWVKWPIGRCVLGHWFIVLFIPSIFLLVFCLIVLSITEGEVVESSTIIFDLFILVFSFVNCCFIHFVRCINVYISYVFFMNWPFCHYKMSCFVSSDNFCLKPILSAISIAPPALLVIVCMVYLLHPWALNSFVSLNLICVSCRQYIAECFFFNPFFQSLPFRVLNLFTFNVVNDKLGFMSASCIYLFLFLDSSSLPSLC